MALPKLFQRIFWHNNTTPAINEDNLNAMSKGLSDVDDRVINLANTITESIGELQQALDDAEAAIAAAEALEARLQRLTENPPYIGTNGNWYVWDTTTGDYVDSGVDASITVAIADITMLSPNATPYVTNTGTSTDPIFHLFIPQGKAVSSISKTGTSGLIDTYTITFNDGTTLTYTVTNGRGVTGVSKTATSGLSDTYTMTYNDGSSTTYIVTNGKGITTLSKTGSSGLTDSYTITYNDGTYTTFNVVNGKPAYQSAVEGGYVGTEAQFEADLANFGPWSQIAQQGASDSEAYANGKRSGSDVPSTDPAYHNNSLWYSQQAATSETNAAQSASDALGAASQISSLLQVPQFTVDFTTGNLMYTMDAVYSFMINTTTGNLEWEVIV